MRIAWLALLTAVLGVTLCGCGGAELASPQPVAGSQRSRAGGISRAARPLAVNTPAPDFTLPDQDGRPVTLSALRGQWVVLYFYPQDDTPGCACEETAFTRLIEQFRNVNAILYGVSADSVATHQFFIQKYKLGLNLLSDRRHKALSDYGAWADARDGEVVYDRTIRSTVLIDPAGVIRYHWPTVAADGHVERVRAKLAELQGSRRP